ncbi:MAG: hypothetical protein ACKVJJ_05955, partial [Fidelibacterota bacterium]
MNISNKDNINIQGSKITVIGFGRSGEGAARLGHYLGASVFISDGGSTDAMVEKTKELEAIGIQIEIGGHTE